MPLTRRDLWLQIFLLLTAFPARHSRPNSIPAHYRNRPDLLAGSFCHARPNGGCCNGRDDPCSVPILGTECYCDEFCDRRGPGHVPDCCPDYWDVCLPSMDRTGIGNLTLSDQPRGCQLKGTTLPINGKVKDNCNECHCTPDGLKCEEDVCLVDPDLFQMIDKSSQRGLGWTPANYSKFWGKKLTEGFVMLTGTFVPDRQTMKMLPIHLRYRTELLPESFDARRKWRYVGKVRDQGWCAASWVFSTIGVFDDRLIIASNGTEVIDLSTQNLLSCNQRGQHACLGGHIERAWGYVRKIGVVPEVCYPYVSGHTGHSPGCSINEQTTLQIADCRGKQGGAMRYTTEPAYRIASREEDIMWEIMTNGPVQALMNVHSDFFFYNNGVYSKSGLGPKVSLSHSVRLIGWGVESTSSQTPTKYWLAINSWGRDWGIGGTFKIRRGVNEVGIERFVLAVRPHLEKKASEIRRPETKFTDKRFSRFPTKTNIRAKNYY